MAITRGATITTKTTTATTTSVSFAHTVDVGTTMIILVLSQEADETNIATDSANRPFWNTTEGFTLIH